MKNKKLYGRLLAFVLLSMCSLFVFSQNHAVSGTVVDAAGETMIGVNVKVKGGAEGIITDINGKYSFASLAVGATLEFSYVGYVTKEIKVGTSNVINVTMTEDAEQLDEVVVIGYQTVKRRDLTGSVASVTAKTLSDAPVSNVAQALQGKLPGVNVISQDGRPDATISIRVRGGGSITQSNEPLILIDGVSGSLDDIPADQVESIDVLKDASSTAIYGARGANGVILVTTKAAKEGKVSVSYNGYVKFNTPVKYLDALDPYDYVSYVWANAAANGTAYQEPFEKLYGIGQYANAKGGIDAYKNVAAVDIQKQVYNESLSHNHDLTITGGTDKTKALLSLNYTDEQGMKINSYRRRANVSFKLNQQISKTFNVGLDVRYTDMSTMSNESTTSGQGSILSYSYRFRPIAASDILGDIDAMREGNIEHYGKTSQWDIYNPVNRINDYDPLVLRQRLRGTLSVNWNLFKGFTYHTDINLRRSWTENRTWSGATYMNYLDDKTGEKLYAGTIDYRKSNDWNMRWTNTVSYDFDLGKANKLNAMLGHEVTNSNGSWMRIQADHFPANFTKENAFAMANQYDQEAGAATTRFSTGVTVPERIVSFFGRLNYTLFDKYLLTATFRADGSSKFSPDHRWGYFPAAAFAWRINEEPFMKNVRWLDNLKLRLSYGEVGNDGIDSNLWSQLWASEDDARWKYAMGNSLQTTYDLASSQMANRDLKWETTITRNLGLDFTVLNNRLWGTIDLYWNSTKDLLMRTTLPGITGFTSTYANIGQTSNKGVEVSLSGVLFKNKDWSITAGANINFNKGRVDKLAEGITGLYGTSWINSGNPGDDYILKVGEPVGLVRGLIYEGLYTTDDFTYSNGMYTLKQGIPDLSTNVISQYHGVDATDRPAGQVAYPGMPKFRDMGDKDGVINSEDYGVIGNMNPVHTGGLNISATYKDFDLGLYFNWSYGNDVYNVNKLAALYGYKETGVYDNKLAIIKDAYKIYDVQGGQLVRIKDPATLQALNVHANVPTPYNETGIVSTLGIEDGSFLRLNTLTLGYTLPKPLLRKAGINNLRIYGTIYNLLTLTGYSGLDPEVNANPSAAGSGSYPTPGMDWGTYPRARSFVLGVNLNF